MEPVFYDLHIHSCLSPCGDDQMTVHNILGMATVKELNLIALTDHNSCKNCPAFLEAAQDYPLTALAGMELCTSEEIHVVCLFPSLEKAVAFDGYVDSHRAHIPNKTAIFGNQLILDSKDCIVGEEASLLVAASDISVEQVAALMQEYGGLAFPAHIDRASYSIIAALGLIPAEYGFEAVEVKESEAFFAAPSNQTLAAPYLTLTNSDAHYLWDISERNHSLPLETPSFAGLQKYFAMCCNRQKTS